MIGPAEIARRARGRWTGRLETVPILALGVHSACNCRCVMCDIWKANADKREISSDDLERHVDSIRSLHVQRVMLTGGEPLLHRNLWTLCSRLNALGIRITLVTTGLLTETHAAEIAEVIDTVVISLDGDRDTHDRIRRVKGGFERIARGVMALRAQVRPPRLIARTVLQRDNFTVLDQAIRAAHRIGFDEISFLAADTWSTAFNRPVPWDTDRVNEVAITAADLDGLPAAIDRTVTECSDLFEEGFIAGGRASLDRIVQHYMALAGRGQFPEIRCNAPWVSAVLEPTGELRPCFFQPAYGPVTDDGFESTLNSERGIAFRRGLDVTKDATCRRCVCSLHLPTTSAV